MFFATSVVNENRSRDYRSGSDTIAVLNNRLDVIRSQYLERSALRGCRQGVCVFPHVKRPVSSLLSPIIADRLCNREDVRFGKSAVERSSTMSAGAEADELIAIARVWL